MLMNPLDDKLKNGFLIHDCTVFPSRNIVESPAGEQHLEPKAMLVLLALTAKAGDVVSREQLLEEVWPDTYSGDAALTRCISLLRSALDEDKDNRRFIETVSKSGYRLIAPVDELPSGSQSEATSAHSRSAASKVALLGWLGLAAIIVAIAAYFWKFAPGTSAPDEYQESPIDAAQSDISGHAIAVMPFANMSGDPANEYLSDGVSEEILNALAQIPKLRVTSRSSSFSFKESNLPLSEVANRLDVESILEGSVRKFGDRIRVSVQLVDARGDVLLWSESYDREFDNVLVLQHEIARAVADTLKVTLGIENTAVPDHQKSLTSTSVEAHDAFLRGRYLVAQRTRQSLYDAVLEFKRPLATEPNHAMALAELAITYLLLSAGEYGDLSSADSLNYGQFYAAKALELDPRMAEAHAASGIVSWRNGNSKIAEQHFRRALEINPSYAVVYHWLSMLQYRNLGKHAESLAASKMSRMLDPVSIPSSTIYIQMLLVRGLHEEATIELEKLKTISMTTYHRMRGELNSLDGKWANVILGYLDALLVDPQLARARVVIPAGLVRLGLEEEAASFEALDNPLLLIRLNKVNAAVRIGRERLQSNPKSVWAKKELAMSLVHAGQSAQAKPLLEQIWQLADNRPALLSVHFFTLRQALALHDLRMTDGDDSGAKEIIAAINAEVQRARVAGISVTRRSSSLDFSEGISEYLSGNKQVGMALITKAVEDGYFIRPDAPYFKSLIEDPDFDPILVRQEATQARERKKLLAIVCENNPYRAVWQPAAETCLEKGSDPISF